MLEYINLFLIMIMILVIIVDSVYLSKARADIKTLTKKLEERPTTNNLLDLAEFQALDPGLKQHYKTYVVDSLMPEVWSVANDVIKKEKINEAITAGDPEIRQGIREIVQNMRGA
jgi:hypothetical protein